jgi:hypothetical protein
VRRCRASRRSVLPRVREEEGHLWGSRRACSYLRFSATEHPTPPARALLSLVQPSARPAPGQPSPPL